jgi:hypothetical protein
MQLVNIYVTAWRHILECCNFKTSKIRQEIILATCNNNALMTLIYTHYVRFEIKYLKILPHFGVAYIIK